MRSFDKERMKISLEKEAEIMKQLEAIYRQVLRDVNDKIKILRGGDEDLQSKIYQRKYQEQLKNQLEVILKYMAEKEYDKIRSYLEECYEQGYIGTLYSLQKQGVPLVIPIDQSAVVKAIQIDSKISKGLYQALGVDANRLKKVIAHEISRGIAGSMTYADIARNVDNQAHTGLSNAMRIVRTEGHRIQQAAAFDCAKAAKERGADVVKIWDATLDGKTRPNHRKLHGQVREVNEPFELGGMKAMYPGEFGIPSEDCNCRCNMLEKSRWELDMEETHWLGRTESMSDEQLQPIADKLHISVSELRKYSNQIIPVKADSYGDFMRQYKKIWNYETSDLKTQVEAERAAKRK